MLMAVSSPAQCCHGLQLDSTTCRQKLHNFKCCAQIEQLDECARESDRLNIVIGVEASYTHFTTTVLPVCLDERHECVVALTCDHYTYEVSQT